MARRGSTIARATRRGASSSARSAARRCATWAPPWGQPPSCAVAALEAARELLDLGAVAVRPEAGAARLAGARPRRSVSPGRMRPRFAARIASPARSCSSWTSASCPARSISVACRAPSEVASAIRAGAINRGPVLAEVAAYALALAARDAGGRSRHEPRQHVDAAAEHATGGAWRRACARLRRGTGTGALSIELAASEAPIGQTYRRAPGRRRRLAAEAADVHARDRSRGCRADR